MYQPNEQMIKDIQNNWKNSWLKYFFAFTDLAVVLNAPNEPNKKDFIKAYLNAWNITRYFLNFLINSKQQKQFQIYTSKFLIVKEILIKNRLYNTGRFENIWMIASSDLFEKFLELDIAGRLSGYQLHLLLENFRQTDNTDHSSYTSKFLNVREILIKNRLYNTGSVGTIWMIASSDLYEKLLELDKAGTLSDYQLHLLLKNFRQTDNTDHSSVQAQEVADTTDEVVNTVDTSAQAKEDVDAKNEEDNGNHSSPQPEEAANTTNEAANTVDTSAQAKEDVDAKNEEDNGNYSSPQPEEAADKVNEDDNTDNSSAQAKVTLTSTSMFNDSSKGNSSKSKKRKNKIKNEL